MLKRLSAALALEAANAIFEQCVFARVPTERIPTATFERSLAAALAGNAGYSSVDITLDIDQEPRGGIVWLDTQSREALEAVSRAISDRRACLLELLRAAGTAPSALEIVVAYALDRTIDAETLTRLRIWDPRSGRERCLDVAKQPDGGLRYIESGIDGRPIDDDERLSIKALRAWKVPESAPPLFGLRRILRWQPPWRAAWWLKRWFAVRFRVKRP